MNITLIQGAFNAIDAIELIAQMLQIKIKYHEDQIDAHSNEEDIKTREAKIKRLQHDLSELRKMIHSKNNQVSVDAIVKIEFK